MVPVSKNRSKFHRRRKDSALDFWVETSSCSSRGLWTFAEEYLIRNRTRPFRRYASGASKRVGIASRTKSYFNVLYWDHDVLEEPRRTSLMSECSYCGPS